MPLKHFFSNLITSLEKDSQGSCLRIHSIYSFFQKEVAVAGFGWQFPFVDLKWHLSLLSQGGQVGQKGVRQLAQNQRL